MTPEPQLPPPDHLRSAIQTQHPQIADEIEGAIKTLRKLKEIASPDGKAASIPDPSGEGLATIAMTGAFNPLASRSVGGDTQALANTQAEPFCGDEIPVLKASATFGRYQIVRMLGRGAMGAVYLAYDTELHRHVALKTPFLGKSTQTIERFYREARTAAQLRSPYLCPIYDVGKVGDVHYLSMAFIDGVPLTKVMAERRLQTVSEMIAVVSKIARGLQKAHDLGVVHRDLKPDNIMIDPDGEPIVLDFGLARRVNDDVQVTMSGVIVGTPAFMSPEQVDGDPAKIGTATDIYSLGIVFYHMLTGQLPFKGSLTSILNQIGTKQPVKPSLINSAIGEGSALEQACMKMIAKSPRDRFPSMVEVAAVLEALIEKNLDTPAIDISTLGRLKTWSTDVFSSLVRPRMLSKSAGGASSESAPDPNTATLADESVRGASWESAPDPNTATLADKSAGGASWESAPDPNTPTLMIPPQPPPA
jgi:serine/threonine protein kinase